MFTCKGGDLVKLLTGSAPPNHHRSAVHKTRRSRQVTQAEQLQEAQLKEYQATKKIDCMLGGAMVWCWVG